MICINPSGSLFQGWPEGTGAPPSTLTAWTLLKLLRHRPPHKTIPGLTPLLSIENITQVLAPSTAEQRRTAGSLLGLVQDKETEA